MIRRQIFSEVLERLEFSNLAMPSDFLSRLNFNDGYFAGQNRMTIAFRHVNKSFCNAANYLKIFLG